MNYQALLADKSNVMIRWRLPRLWPPLQQSLSPVPGQHPEGRVGHSREVMQGEIDTLKESSTAMTAASRKHLDELKDDLDARSRQLAAQANQAKKEAVSYADEKSKQLESEQQKANQQISQVSSAVSMSAARPIQPTPKLKTSITT